MAIVQGGLIYCRCCCCCGVLVLGVSSADHNPPAGSHHQACTAAVKRQQNNSKVSHCDSLLALSRHCVDVSTTINAGQVERFELVSMHHIMLTPLRCQKGRAAPLTNQHQAQHYTLAVRLCCGPSAANSARIENAPKLERPQFLQHAGFGALSVEGHPSCGVSLMQAVTYSARLASLTGVRLPRSLSIYPMHFEAFCNTTHKEKGRGLSHQARGTRTGDTSAA
jgi:hypothetical protein